MNINILPQIACVVNLFLQKNYALIHISFIFLQIYEKSWKF